MGRRLIDPSSNQIATPHPTAPLIFKLNEQIILLKEFLRLSQGQHQITTRVLQYQ